jgi:hypothetical protein
VFDAVDGLNLTPAEALAIKYFFSREIEDIVGNREEERSERHETAEMWLDRLRKVGFFPDLNFLFHCNSGYQNGISISKRNGYIGLDYKNQTVVALMALRLSNPTLVA